MFIFIYKDNSEHYELEYKRDNAGFSKTNREL